MMSYVHAGVKVLHFAELVEIHWIFGVWKNPVNFALEVLITSRIEQEVVKSGGQCRLDGICAGNDGEGAI